jgi:hypothetical protein
LFVGCKNITLGTSFDFLSVEAPEIYKTDPRMANSIAVNTPISLRVGLNLIEPQSQLRGKDMSIVVYTTSLCSSSLESPLADIAQIAKLPLDARLKLTYQGVVQEIGRSFVLQSDQNNAHALQFALTLQATEQLDTCLVFRAVPTAITSIDTFNRSLVSYTRVFTFNGSRQ